MPNINQKQRKQNFYIKGMTCATCANHVEKALEKIENVKNVSVNLATESAYVISQKDIPFETIQKAVSNSGYKAIKEIEEIDEEKRLRDTKHHFLLSILITIPLSVLMIFHMLGFEIPYYILIELTAGGIVIFYTGFSSIKSAWIALIHKHTNMDTLIFLGSVTAWTTALLKFAGLEIVSFGALGAMIVALHLTGRFIESSLRNKAAKEIKSLMKLQAKDAIVLREGEKEKIPLEQVKKGDTVLVNPGERIPLDGELIKGETSVDESMVTGESIPVKKEKADQLIGGSLNLNSPVQIKVHKDPNDSFLAQMITLIKEAQGSKVPIQALADKITNFFVPLVITAAITGAVLWFFNYSSWYPALENIRGILPWIPRIADPMSFSIFVFVSSIVIACPCALGLATPMALIAGTGKAAKRGLLIRNSQTIQTVKQADVVVLDKTGTITRGSPEVIDYEIDPDNLEMIVELESQSSHPLAKAIAEIGLSDGSKQDKEAINFEAIKEKAGKGVTGFANGIEYFVGKPSDPTRYKDLLTEGKTVVEARKDSEIIGWFAIEDTIRPDSVEAIRKLRKMGMTIAIATGDNKRTAQAVARRVGIDTVHAEILPSDKVDIINDYQSEGKIVIMAGDGINDAAALKGADIGISFSSGTDLAIDNSDIVIVSGGISKIVDTIEISSSMLHVIKQNLFWAFFYNLVAIPIALMGWLHPAISEAAMGFSSITVVMNSLRIKKRPKDKKMSDKLFFKKYK